MQSSGGYEQRLKHQASGQDILLIIGNSLFIPLSNCESCVIKSRGTDVSKFGTRN